jgi:hypothetical protein
VVGGGERVHTLDHALEPLPPLALLPGASFPIGTREDYPHNLHHGRSEDSLESEEPPKPPSALLLALCGLLALTGGRGRGIAWTGALGRFWSLRKRL